MPITVRAGGVLKSLLGGQGEVEAQGGTVGEVLGHLGVRERLCDDDGKVRRHFNIHVNDGEDVRLRQQLETPVEDGDTVTILSAIAGGAEVSRKVWLTFSKDLVDRPLIWEVGRKFDVVTLVRQASATRSLRLVGLEFSGGEEEVEKAFDYLMELGVSVEPVELDIVE